MRKPENLTLYYIFLAVSCTAVGTVITFVVLFVCEYYAIDISRNLWILAIPVVSSVLLNVFFLEVYRKLTQR